MVRVILFRVLGLISVSAILVSVSNYSYADGGDDSNGNSDVNEPCQCNDDCALSAWGPMCVAIDSSGNAFCGVVAPGIACTDAGVVDGAVTDGGVDHGIVDAQVDARESGAGVITPGGNDPLPVTDEDGCRVSGSSTSYGMILTLAIVLGLWCGFRRTLRSKN